MHIQGTALLNRSGAASGPVVGGPKWFETDGRPFSVLIDLPLSFDHLVAAVVRGCLDPRELAADDDVRGGIALTIAVEGLTAVEQTAADLANGAPVDAAWLAFCRQRVREVFGAAR